MWFESKFDKAGMRSMIVMLLCLNARIGEVANLCLQAKTFALIDDHLCQRSKRELFGELVEDAVLAFRGRRVDGQFDALDGIAQVDIAARLLAFAINTKRVADSGLDAEAVEGCAVDLIIVKTGCQARILPGLPGLNAIDNTLIQVGGA